ncbi:hypothetical protein [Flavobacterium urumqiense]|uniref:Uncharacterized protein n=1 Tax=Flavobacterium urumqiense TaxID=935224 RepID=A0A1H5WT98_9FLAO|nr:hypothetical protein [Flavobacterium urumqiense]SEG02187.1 hypothetical protein SAMN04488130_10526 [Flavobacterium urumqiense]
MNKKLSFSSPEPTGAIITQFLIAVQKCFEMKVDNCVYIETDGDVSIFNTSNNENNKQIEVKEYFDPLTDSHLNFWKTLNNWMNPKFNHEKYNELVILTTQEIGVKSIFNKWNDLDLDSKYAELKNIVVKSNGRFIMREKEWKNGDKKVTKPKSLKLMENILETNNEVKIKNIINKVFIIDSATKRDLLPKEIIERELKHIPENNKNQAFNSLLGFVIRKEIYNVGWEISYSDFIQECKDINQRFKEESILFPIIDSFKETNEFEIEEKKSYAFAIKIEEIKHEEEVIIEAISDYCFTIKTLMSEFNHRSSKLKSVKSYESDLLRTFKSKHRIASNNCNVNKTIRESQIFYDETISAPVQSFDIFNDTPMIYRNGVIHNLINENDNLYWKLNPKNS